MIDKSEMKKSIYHSAGCDADDWLEASKRTRNAFEGAKQALKKSSQDLLGIVEKVKQDLDDDKLDGLEPAEIADYAILQITRCRDALANASQHYENRQITAQGEITAYEKLVDHFKKLYDQEDAKVERFKEAIASGEIRLEDGEMIRQAGNGQLTGVRPAMSIAAQRKAEAAAEEATESPEEPQDGSEGDEDVAEVKAEEPDEKPKKPRKRRRKKKDEDVDAKDS